MPDITINLDKAVPAVVTVRGVPLYHHALDRLRHRKISGVYVIIDAGTGAVLYVGESHTGRLFDTITRHFRKWKIDPRQDATGRRRGGTTYSRNRVKVAWTTCRAELAVDAQAALITTLNPRDNSNGAAEVVKPWQV